MVIVAMTGSARTSDGDRAFEVAPDAMNRKLGCFLLVVATWQFIVYAMEMRVSDDPDLVYLDPRLGLAFFGMLMHAGTPPFAASWTSAALLGGVGLALSRSPSWVRTYLVLEVILSVPTLAMFVLMVAANPGAAPSVLETLVPIALFVVVSVIPFVFGVRILRRAA